MLQKIYQVDAFASNVFEGNPAAVCIMNQWISDNKMQNIAMENNLAETAFLVPREKEGYNLRWFTPLAEVDLCGHATLASAHVLFHHYNFSAEQILFFTRSGKLTVQRINDGQYQMNFPSDVPQVSTMIENYKGLVNVEIKEAYYGKDDMLLIVQSETEVRGLVPNFEEIKRIDARGIIVSAPGVNVDFVSRCFYPCVGVDEDPVTGSAHTLMTPYWSNRLKKNKLHARQLSRRGGNIHCQHKENRVLLTGNAVTYLEGQISI